MRPIATACLLAGVTVLLYSFQLGQAPLSAAETIQLQQAQKIGGGTPLFFRVDGETWLQPMAVYATALFGALGAGEVAGRAASVLAGAINVALVFAAARMIAGRDWVAIAGAVLLLVTPAHWLLARLGTAAIFPTPFVLAWLIGMLHFFRWDSMRSLALAGAALGAGTYAHPAAPLVMGWLWVMSLAALVAGRRLAARNFVILGAAFAALLVPAAIWFSLYPETYPDTFGRWAILKAHLRMPMDGLRAQINWNTLSNRTTLFWGLLDPSLLFFAGRGQAIAPLLLCSAVLVPLGAVRLMTSGETGTRILVLSAALIPPLVASTFGLPQDLSTVSPMVATAALLAAAGMQGLADRRNRWTWLAGAAVVVSMVQLFGLR